MVFLQRIWFSTKRRFIDKVRVRVKGGDGGQGCASFERDIHGVGGPDGGIEIFLVFFHQGNGGFGGNVYFQTSPEPNDLTLSSYNIKAKNGSNGTGQLCHGRKGEDITIVIPAGTFIREIEKPTPNSNVVKYINVVKDMSEPNVTIKVATGGAGGLGNKAFRSNIRKIPLLKSGGMPGSEHWLELELKTIADVGMVGFPNAGKSTLLNAISSATPKIANYPFTTLHPQVGIVKGGESEPFSIADLPGLIEGASENRGLGHSFLRHIERVQVLLFVLDAACVSNSDPLSDLHVLFNELDLYAPGLLSKPKLVFCNKADVRIKAVNANVERIRAASGGNFKVIAGSAKTGAVEELIMELKKILSEHKIAKQSTSVSNSVFPRLL